MTLALRRPTHDALPALSALCLRSKAVWGYDAGFLAACRAELTFRPEELADTDIIVAVEASGENGDTLLGDTLLGDTLLGVAQVGVGQVGVGHLGSERDGEAELLKLFVEPGDLKRGVGRALFTWAVETAQSRGARRLIIDADPGAAPFYRRMGARDIGETASASIPGRTLPQLAYDL